MSESSKIQMDYKYIGRLAGTLFAISAVTALLLGLVNYVTAPVIEQIQAEKKAAAMAAVLPADEYPAVAEFVPTGSVAGLYEAVSGGETVGYVAEVTSSGFGGAMSITVGVSADGAVTGVSVTDNSETQGVGTQVVGDQAVLDRFIGMSGTITVNEGDNRFDAVTGATVSSKAVTAGVNAALEAAGAYLQ